MAPKPTAAFLRPSRDEDFIGGPSHFRPWSPDASEVIEVARVARVL